MKKAVLGLAGLLIGLMLVWASPAQAVVDTQVSPCVPGWYVNPDETALKPTSTEAGFVFDGPSLAHHAVTPVLLASAPTNGAFTTVGAVTGVKPLFKMETATPYSTINKTADGKYWSSKIGSGSGSQASPVSTIAELAALGPYNDGTEVVTFGVGYANDTGNKATVSSVKFGATTYSLTCTPSSASTSASATASPKPSTTATTTKQATAPPSASQAATLPVTGPGTTALWVIGGATVLIGAAAILVSRKRRNHFQA